MKVINTTSWCTRDLKRILQRCAEMEFDDGTRRKRLQVTVISARSTRCTGYAWLKTNRCVLRIPSPNQGIRETISETISETEYTQALQSHRSVSLSFDGQGHYYRIRSRRQQSPLAETTLRHLKQDLAYVACHEFAHCRGMTHRTMPRYLMHGTRHERYAWAADLPLTVQKRPVVSSNDRVEKREAHARVMCQRAQIRYKRAKTILAKWQKKVAYYDHKVEGTST